MEMNSRVILYTFIDSDTSKPPTVYGQKMLKEADIGMLMESVAKKQLKQGCDKGELFVCDIWKSKIHRELRRHDNVWDNISQKSDDIFIYHCKRPDGVEIKDSQRFVVNNQHRVVSRQQYIGYPLLVAFSRKIKITMNQIRNKLWTLIQPLLHDQTLKVNDDNLPFEFWAAWGFNNHAKLTDNDVVFDLLNRKKLKFIIHWKDPKQYKSHLHSREQRLTDASALSGNGSNESKDGVEAVETVTTLKHKMQEMKAECMKKFKKMQNDKEAEIKELNQKLTVLVQEKNQIKKEHKEFREKHAVMIEEKRKMKEKLDQFQQTTLRLTQINNNLFQQQKEEKKQEQIIGLKDEIIFLDKKMNEFGNVYNRNKLSIMFENNSESVNVEQELQRLEFRNKSFGKTLQDLSAYIKSITVPNIMQYETWNVNMIILWIKTLDNGKYLKYCNVLSEGFMNDGIENGETLLAMDDQKDLRNEPFGIKSLPDRKALIRHFQSLPTLKQQLMNSNQNENHNKEGAITPYV